MKLVTAGKKLIRFSIIAEVSALVSPLSPLLVDIPFSTPSSRTMFSRMYICHHDPSLKDYLTTSLPTIYPTSTLLASHISIAKRAHLRMHAKITPTAYALSCFPLSATRHLFFSRGSVQQIERGRRIEGDAVWVCGFWEFCRSKHRVLISVASYSLDRNERMGSRCDSVK